MKLKGGKLESDRKLKYVRPELKDFNGLQQTKGFCETGSGNTGGTDCTDGVTPFGCSAGTGQ